MNYNHSENVDPEISNLIESYALINSLYYLINVKIIKRGFKKPIIDNQII